MRMVIGRQIPTPNKVSAMDYYVHYMHTHNLPETWEVDIIRDTLTCGGILKQQFDVDN